MVSAFFVGAGFIPAREPGGGKPRPYKGTRGFTLIEIMAVLAIVGVILLAVVPNLDGQVPTYRLRSGARKVASSIELCQSSTIADRKRYVLVYDLDRNTYQILLPEQDGEDGEGEGEGEGEDVEGDLGDLGKGGGARPRDDMEHGNPPPNPDAGGEDGEEEEEEDETDADYENREGLGIQELPEDVVFELVIVGDEEKRSGRVYVPFSHLGNDGAHVVGVTLGSERNTGQGEQVWVKFSPLTRTIRFTEERPELRTLESETE